MNQEPTVLPGGVVTFTIKIDGQDIKDVYGMVSIDISKEVNKIPSAKIVFKDGCAPSQDFLLSSGEDFVPGNEIEVFAGYQAEGEVALFKGVIIKHCIKAKNSGSTLVVECKDQAVRLTVGRKNAHFDDLKDSEIMESIVANYKGLTIDAVETSVTHEKLVQYYTTDWDFMVSRAEANGMLVFLHGESISVMPPDTEADPVINLLYGANVIAFEAEMDARTQYAGVTSHSWDASTQSIATSEAANPALKSPGNLDAIEHLAPVIGLETFHLQHPQMPQEERQAWADAQLLRSHLSKVTGSATIRGFNAVKPGDIVALGGSGERFNGNAFVSSVHHRIADNWITEIKLGLAPQPFAKNPDIADTPAAGLLPAISGLQIGVVTQLHGDPSGEHRILVKMPAVDNDSEGVWARVATLDAGDGRGSFFLPEIEDEVVLGFLNDDPRSAIVLGMLHSSAKPPPVNAADDLNHEKGFVTRSQLKLMFNDDDMEKTIQIETPSGNKITLSDKEGGLILMEDQNQNKIETSPSGVTIESASNLTIKAKGDLSIEGSMVNIN